MVQITISDELKQKLLASPGVVELVDASGRCIGRLVPDQPANNPLDVQSAFPELTPEEIDRRCNEPGPRHTMKEVIEQFSSRIDDE